VQLTIVIHTFSIMNLQQATILNSKFYFCNEELIANRNFVNFRN